MAEGKKSFVLYADLKHTVDLLENEVAGKLFKHILAYVNDEDPKSEDLILKVAFEPIKRQLKRDLKDWETQKTGRITSATVGNIARWHPDIYEQILKKQLTIQQAVDLIKSQKSDASKSDNSDAVESEPIGNVANVAVNVTVNDNVTVIDNIPNSDELPKTGNLGIVGVIHKNKNLDGVKRIGRRTAKKKIPSPDVEPFQDIYISLFNVAWIEKRKTKYKWQPKDFASIKKLSKILRQDKEEWTEEVMKIEFADFLNKAKHDSLISKNNFENFTFPFFLNRVNSILSINLNNNGTYRQTPSASVKGNSKSAGAENLLASFKKDLNAGRE